jgi:aminopeptidase N
VVQLRADPGDYWHFNSNQAVFAAGSPGFFSVKANSPGANLAHEIGHFWTSGSGPAANFLREGWATYVESLALEREYGIDTARLFWKQHARHYFDRYDGKMSMWESGNQTNLNYDKGSWVFRMLEVAVGAKAFQQAMTDFSRRSLAGAADWETLADCFQRQNVPDFDARQFLLPWLKEKRAPRLSVQTQGRTVTIVQSGPLFVLPLTLEGATSNGTERHLVWLRDSKTEVQFAGEVSGVRIDPDQVLLLAP